MRQEYFLHNGKYYKSGTVIRVKQMDYISARNYETDAVFLYHYVETDKFVIKVEGRTCSYPKDIFDNILVGVTDKTNMSAVKEANARFVIKNKKTFVNELSIDGMFIAWTWYVFIMAILTIFKDCIIGWIGASIIFFSYRDEKLRKAGYK